MGVTKEWYRGKVLAVEVMTVQAEEDFKVVSEWVLESGGLMGECLLNTATGIHDVGIGDSVVKYPDGSFNVCSPQMMRELYDPIR